MSIFGVAPFAGAWIEICVFCYVSKIRGVAPFAGAWIEICGRMYTVEQGDESLPLRERGLKFFLDYQSVCFHRRSLCGSVD